MTIATTCFPILGDQVAHDAWLSSIGSDLVKGLPAAFVALIIGAIAASIAYRQYRVAAAKLKLDLFDKRFAVFHKTWAILSETVISGTRGRGYGMSTPFNNFLPEAAFLFGKDVEKYLDEAATKWAELRGLEGAESRAEGAKLESITTRQTELNLWFHKEASEGAKRLFGRYLNFERWK
jgi:hypothetical protein